MSGNRYFGGYHEGGGGENDWTFTSGSSRPSSREDFRDGRGPRPNDIFIAIMGVTGSGKSSFIKQASGDQSIRIGHGLESCTSTVEVHAYDSSPNQTIFLIDTPGFDDTKKTDDEVLRDVATWLGNSYKEKIMLHGIIYLHRISDARMQGSAKKNLALFKKLCGQDALRRVVLVTTMWDKVSEREGVAREQALLDTPECWGYMKDNGSICCRHRHQPATARDIIQILAQHRSTIATSLQKEMVDDNRPLEETSAGQELKKELREEREFLLSQMRKTEESMKEALKQQDREAQRALREERSRYTSMIRQMKKRTDSLKDTIDELIRQQRNSQRYEREVAGLVSRLEFQSLYQTRPRRRRQTRMPQQSAPSPSAAHAIRVTPPEWVPPTTPYTEIGTPNFSCAIDGCTFTGVNSIHQNTTLDMTEIMPMFEGGRWDFVAYGSHPTRQHFIFRSTRAGFGSQWITSPRFDDDYPKAARILKTNGFKNLQYIALGRDGIYFARWTDRAWSASASINALNAIAAAYSRAKRQVFVAAFGVRESYFLSYGENRRYLGYFMDLQGQYPALSAFLADMQAQGTPISVNAIALSNDSPTDFVLVYNFLGESRLRIYYFVSNPVVDAALRAWWSRPTGW